MSKLYRFLALSDHRGVRWTRGFFRWITNLSVPAPHLVTRPLLTLVLLTRAIYYFVSRVFFCEPLFKAYCTRYGHNLHTGAFLHWVQGRGDLIVGNNVTIDGKCNFFFAVRYSDRPTLTIGDNTGIGHNCAFVVGKQITIGRHCRIASAVQMFDVPGHPADPADRLAGLPSSPDEVRPIVIEDNVWIGSSTIIFPGVTIGEGSIVAMGSVVMGNVAANTLVAGNPARLVRSLVKIEPPGRESKEAITRTHG